LEVAGGEPVDGSNLQLGKCSDSDTALAQNLLCPEGGTGQIRWALFPDLCVDVADGSQQNGNNLQFSSCVEGSQNQQFVIKIEEANQELLDLKRRSGRTVKILNGMKKKLSTLTAEARILEDDIKERKAMLAKTEHDINKVMEEKEAARKEHKKLRAQSRQAPDMPQVADYVNQKAEQYELEAQCKNWNRKLEIAAAAVKHIRANIRNGTQILAAA